MSLFSFFFFDLTSLMFVSFPDVRWTNLTLYDNRNYAINHLRFVQWSLCLPWMNIWALSNDRSYVWSETIHQLLSILSKNCHQNQMFKRQLSWECKMEITGLQSQAREALWAEPWPCRTFSLLSLVAALNISRVVSGLDILSSSRSELYKIRKKKTMCKITWHWTCIWENNASDSTGQRSELPGLIVCWRNLGLDLYRKEEMHLCYLLDGLSMIVQFLLLRSRFVNLCELTSELDETTLEDFRASSKMSSTSIVRLVCRVNIRCDLFSVIVGQSIVATLCWAFSHADMVDLLNILMENYSILHKY